MAAASSFLIGWLIDWGHAGRIYLMSGFGGFFGFLMLSLPCKIACVESEVWLVIWLAVLGNASAGGYTSIYLIYETIAYRIGFKNENNVKLMAPSLLNAYFSCGRTLGAVFVGGVFMDYFGYYYSCFLLSGLFLFSSLLCGYVLFTKCMLRKIFYSNQEQKSETDI